MKASEWTAALRSGHYGQTRGRLADGHGNFCCLGVLCEARGLEKSAADNFILYTFDRFSPGHKEMSGIIIPEGCQSSILEDLDLSKAVDGEGSLHTILVEMNDDGKTFADFIDMVVAGGVNEQ